MIAYTSWDGLQAMARQYDADLSLVPGERLEMAPHWTRALSRYVRHAAERVRVGLTGMQEEVSLGSAAGNRAMPRGAGEQ